MPVKSNDIYDTSFWRLQESNWERIFCEGRKERAVL